MRFCVFDIFDAGCAPCPSGNYIYDNLSICTCKSADYGTITLSQHFGVASNITSRLSCC